MFTTIDDAVIDELYDYALIYFDDERAYIPAGEHITTLRQQFPTVFADE